jgi:hypothetical protein
MSYKYAEQHGEKVTKSAVKSYIKEMRALLRDLEKFVTTEQWHEASLCGEDLDPMGGEIRVMVDLLEEANAY